MAFSSITAQNEIYVIRNTVIIDSIKHIIPEHILTLPDNTAYILGNVNENNSGILFKTNNIIKTAEIPFGTIPFVNLQKPVPLPDGSLRIYGTVQNQNFFNPVIYNIKSDLTKVDEIHISTDQSTYIGGLAIVDSHNIIVAQAIKDQSNTYNISVFQFNTKTNQEIWSNRIISETHELPTSIHMMNDLSIIVLARRYDYTFSSSSPIIYKLSPMGEKEWLKDMTSSVYRFHNQDVVCTQDERLIYINSYQGRSNEVPQTFVFAINPKNGATINKLRIDSLRANGIIYLSDGTCMIYGSYITSVNNTMNTTAAYSILNQNFVVANTYKMDYRHIIYQDLNNEINPKEIMGSDIYTATITSNNDVIMAGYMALPSMNTRGSSKTDYTLIIVNKFANH